LKDAVQSPSHPHSFLFSGPSGIGKTTMARIIGSVFNAHVNEIDAATNSGVDAMRTLVEYSGYQPLLAANELYIIDECHALTKAAWQALLKLIEEPPKCIYIALATTELTKVPETIRTRCYHVPLKPCKPTEIEDLLKFVCEVEQWQVNYDVLSAIIQAATGQPRKGLSYLQAGHICQTRDEVAQVVAQVDSESSPVSAMMYFLLKGGRDWTKVRSWLSEVVEGEEAFASATGYLINVMLKPDCAEETAKKAQAILDALFFPRSGFDRKGRFVAAITAYLWS
jgi:DNA polymerase III gamma/tau subunit